MTELRTTWARVTGSIAGIFVGLSFALGGGCQGAPAGAACLSHDDCVQTAGEPCVRCVSNGEGAGGVCEAVPDTAYPGDCLSEGTSGETTMATVSESLTTTDAPTTTMTTTASSDPTTETTDASADSTSAAAESSSSGGGDGVCGSDHTEGSAAIDACVSTLCCPEYDACAGDPACAACLAEEPPGKGCIEQPAYGDYQACVYFGCPPTLCSSDLVIPDRNGDPDFDCHACLHDPCCGEAQFCLQDPVACEACLAEADPLNPVGAACQAAELQIQQGAALIHMCTAANCAAECPQ